MGKQEIDYAGVVDARQPLSHFLPNSRVPVDEVYFSPVNWPESIGPRVRFPQVRTTWNEPTHFWRQGPDDTTCVPLAFANACEAMGIAPDNDFMRCMIAYAQRQGENGLKMGTNIDQFFSMATLLNRSNTEVGRLNGTGIFFAGTRDLARPWGDLFISYFSSPQKRALIASIINDPPDENIPVVVNNYFGHAVCIAGVRVHQEGQMDVLVIDSETGFSAVPIDQLARVLVMNESPVTITRGRGAKYNKWPPANWNRQKYEEYFLKTVASLTDASRAGRLRDMLFADEASKSDVDIIDVSYTVL